MFGYHYCPVVAFKAITSTCQMFSSTRYSSDCDFGPGVYATGKEPAQFEDKLQIVYNNYPRATGKYQYPARPAENPKFPSPEQAGYCIPLLVQLEHCPALPLSEPLEGKEIPFGAIQEKEDRARTDPNVPGGQGAHPFNPHKHDIYLVHDKCRFAWFMACDDEGSALMREAEQGRVDVLDAIISARADLGSTTEGGT